MEDALKRCVVNLKIGGKKVSHERVNHEMVCYEGVSVRGCHKRVDHERVCYEWINHLGIQRCQCFFHTLMQMSLDGCISIGFHPFSCLFIVVVLQQQQLSFFQLGVRVEGGGYRGR